VIRTIRGKEKEVVGGGGEKAENEENKKIQVGGGNMESENRLGKGTQKSQKRKEVQKEWK
jgi:hypothetical protein